MEDLDSPESGIQWQANNTRIWRPWEIDVRSFCFVLQMLMDLGANVYSEDFEQHFLLKAAEFYQV